jgi:adenine deaminase
MSNRHQELADQVLAAFREHFDPAEQESIGEVRFRELHLLVCEALSAELEATAERDFDSLHPLIRSHAGEVMFCSDDKHPDDLVQGHIDRLVARAVAAGHELMDVLRCGCVNPVLHYRLPVGLLRVGDPTDAVEVEDLCTFRVLRTWVAGQLVADDGRSRMERVPVSPVNRFNARPIVPADLDVPPKGSLLRVIEVLDGQLLTREVLLFPRVKEGRILRDLDRDILLLCVLNRYRPVPPAVALVRGSGVHREAIASSVAHDSHNIVAVGAGPLELCTAVNALVDCGGGISLADANGVDLVPLPVGGLMSTENGDLVAERYASPNGKVEGLGSSLRAPFMTLFLHGTTGHPEVEAQRSGAVRRAPL